MGAALHLRKRPPDAGSHLLQTKYEAMATQHNSSTEGDTTHVQKRQL